MPKKQLKKKESKKKEKSPKEKKKTSKEKEEVVEEEKVKIIEKEKVETPKKEIPKEEEEASEVLNKKTSEEEDSELEEVLENEEDLEQSSEMMLPFYPNQGSASLDQVDATGALIPLEEQARQAPRALSSQKNLTGYDSSSPASYSTGGKKDYETGQDSDKPYETGREEKTSPEKDLRGYEGVGATRPEEEAKETNPFLDQTAGARGKVQDFGKDYQVVHQETETYGYKEKAPEGEIDVDKSRKEMKKQFFDA